MGSEIINDSNKWFSSDRLNFNCQNFELKSMKAK